MREVFEEVVGRGLSPNLAVWNTLLASLAAQGAWLDALAALRQVRKLFAHTPPCRAINDSTIAHRFYHVHHGYAL